MRGSKARLDDELDAFHLVAKEPGIRLNIGTVISGLNRHDLTGLAEARSAY